MLLGEKDFGSYKITRYKLSYIGFEYTVSFYKSNNDKNKLAVFFPGAGYSCFGPALYYPTNIFLENNFDILQVEYDLRDISENLSSSFLKGFASDFFNQLEELISFDVNYEKFEEIFIVAKSAGTKIASQIAKLDSFKDIKSLNYIYLTPAWRDLEFFNTTLKVDKPCLHIIGTNDAHHNNATCNDFRSQDHCVLELESADHGLDVEGSTEKSLGCIADICDAVRSFIANKNI